MVRRADGGPVDPSHCAHILLAHRRVALGAAEKDPSVRMDFLDALGEGNAGDDLGKDA